ncbi:unnamed protein product [Ectocarpus sp. 6 AP-2014]
MFVCLVLVVLMQAGFAAYEVGSIRSTSASSILKKNIGDATLSLIAWVLVGYALSDGKDQLRIVGGSYFGLVQGENKIIPVFATDDRDVGTALLECLFRWSFAATCTTIVSGAVADRIYVKAYFVYAFLTSAVFYPLLAHAVWADEGWASPFLTSEGESDAFLNCGFVDFAGSGVVHMLGGGIGLVMSIMVENRSDRFIDADPELVEKNTSATLDRRLLKACTCCFKETKSVLRNYTSVLQLNEYHFRPSDPSWMTLGCLLLWLGWYGFNCGSTLQISSEETRNAAGRAALNTTIGAAVGCVSSMGFEIIYHWWSPKYRRGEFINDPLDYIPQLSSPAGTGPRRRKTTGATDYVVDPEDEHNRGTFRWRLSTHKSIHGAACNGVIVGLVGVTAGCATMLPWHAIWVSIVSALLYHVSYRGIICCKIDDAINAAAVHLVGGWWGVVAAGFTVDNAARVDLGFPSEEDGCTPENQASVNLLMAMIILAYSIVCGGLLWVGFSIVGIATKAKMSITTRQEKDPNLTEAETKIHRDIDTIEDRLDRLDLEGGELEMLKKRMKRLESARD